MTGFVGDTAFHEAGGADAQQHCVIARLSRVLHSAPHDQTRTLSLAGRRHGIGTKTTAVPL